MERRFEEGQWVLKEFSMRASGVRAEASVLTEGSVRGHCGKRAHWVWVSDVGPAVPHPPRPPHPLLSGS